MTTPDFLRSDRLGPPLLAVAAVLAGNLLIAALGIGGQGGDSRASEVLPPGWVVGLVWTLLFASLGASYVALKRADGDTMRERLGIVGLGLICMAYPVYTAGFEDARASLIGAVATLVVVVALIAWVARTSGPAALWLAPFVPWLTFASWALTT